MSKNLQLFSTLVAIALLLGCLVCASIAEARSAYSPRHSGMEPPGGPRSIETLPGTSPGRTPEGGMGHIDAYGNAVEKSPNEEKQPRRRPRPGAYGAYGEKSRDNHLPEPGPSGSPLWSF